MIITIARECGAGGLPIAERLGEHFHIPVYDKVALRNIAKEKNIYDKYGNFLAEQRVNSLLYAISMGDYVTRITKTPEIVLQQLIGKQDCILIGRCGNYVYRNRADSVSFYFHGALASRVHTMEQLRNLSEKEAKLLVENTDAERASYHKYYTKEIWGEAKYYDAALDTSKVTYDQATELCIAYCNAVGLS